MAKFIMEPIPNRLPIINLFVCFVLKYKMWKYLELLLGERLLSTIDLNIFVIITTQFQNPVMKVNVAPLHKIYNSILI
jgi:hypothetical protein